METAPYWAQRCLGWKVISNHNRLLIQRSSSQSRSKPIIVEDFWDRKFQKLNTITRDRIRSTWSPKYIHTLIQNYMADCTLNFWTKRTFYLWKTWKTRVRTLRLANSIRNSWKSMMISETQSCKTPQASKQLYKDSRRSGKVTIWSCWIFKKASRTVRRRWSRLVIGGRRRYMHVFLYKVNRRRW